MTKLSESELVEIRGRAHKCVPYDILQLCEHIDSLQAELQEARAESEQLRQYERDHQYVLSTEIDYAKDKWRVRLIAAVREMTIPDNARDGHPLSDAGYNLAIDDVVELIQSTEL